MKPREALPKQPAAQQGSILSGEGGILKKEAYSDTFLAIEGNKSGVF